MAYEWTQIGKISTGVDGNYSFTELSSSPDEGHPYQVLMYHDLYNTEKSDNIVLDTDFGIDIVLTLKTTALIGAGHVVAMKNAISVAGNQSQNGSLVVTGITTAYQVSVHALDGRVLYRGMVSPGNAIVPLKSASRGIILRLHNGADNAVEHRFLNRMH
jgi:hypothetical protein